MDYQQKVLAERQGGTSSTQNEDGLYDAAGDERNRREELKRRKEEQERQEFTKTVHAMSVDKDRQESMRRQNELVHIF